MSFADRIRRCHDYDPSRVVPLMAGKHRIGLLMRDNAAALRRFTDVFAVENDLVRLVATGDAGALSAQVDAVVEALVVERQVPKWRNETFDVSVRWGEAPLFRLDRGAVPFFGVRAYGAHLNGYRYIDGRLHLWVGRRAADKRVEPTKLDNLVAGGIGNGHGAWATMLKEGEEEAGVPRSLMERAKAVGAVTYRMELDGGIRDDVLFVYDLEVPAEFEPHNNDGEISEFTLMPADQVLERIHTTSDFKFNVNLVVLDFAVRHGLLRPEDPEYLDVAAGCHRPLD